MPIVTMQSLGCRGRFANQLFQYGFLRVYAKRYGAELQVRPWIGTHLFGLVDPPVSVALPTCVERTEDGSIYSQAAPPVGDELLDHDFIGYGQHHTSYYTPDERVFWCDLFRPAKHVASRLEPAIDKLVYDNGTVVGLHIRRGDYGKGTFPLTPIDWYLQWLKENWGRFYRPRLFVATEDQALLATFAEYDPWTAQRASVVLENEPHALYNYLPEDLTAGKPYLLDFYPDFYLLSQCHVIVGSNSTFNFAAAMLAPCLHEYWRASLLARNFVQTEPWNDYPLLHEHVKDYPDIPGITH
jgi:hypothetical protein